MGNHTEQSHTPTEAESSIMFTSRVGLSMLRSNPLAAAAGAGRRPVFQAAAITGRAAAAPAAAAAPQRRLFSSSKVVKADANSAKTRAYLSTDNDIRRLPEPPADPSKPQPRPDWEVSKKKD